MSSAPNDPERREKILAATRELITEVGVDGISHRKVAAKAGVPLGSMTYYFQGREELLFEVFTRFSAEVSQIFDDTMAAVETREQAVDAVIRLTSEYVLADRTELVLSHELYALAAREPRYREVTHNWMAASRRALERHFDPDTARMLDALIEGLSIHRALDVGDHPNVAEDAVRRIVGK